mmetsp:Transcript_21889/g.52310  ORF Transcript_21889/g.52310 Transcript_21889/m.52310 type:complete len:270 (-) Transcript_21889:80-889(-)
MPTLTRSACVPSQCAGRSLAPPRRPLRLSTRLQSTCGRSSGAGLSSATASRPRRGTGTRCCTTRAGSSSSEASAPPTPSTTCGGSPSATSAGTTSPRRTTSRPCGVLTTRLSSTGGACTSPAGGRTRTWSSMTCGCSTYRPSSGSRWGPRTASVRGLAMLQRWELRDTCISTEGLSTRATQGSLTASSDAMSRTARGGLPWTARTSLTAARSAKSLRRHGRAALGCLQGVGTRCSRLGGGSLRLAGATRCLWSSGARTYLTRQSASGLA